MEIIYTDGSKKKIYFAVMSENGFGVFSSPIKIDNCKKHLKKVMVEKYYSFDDAYEIIKKKYKFEEFEEFGDLILDRIVYKKDEHRNPFRYYAFYSLTHMGVFDSNNINKTLYEYDALDYRAFELFCEAENYIREIYIELFSGNKYHDYEVKLNKIIDKSEITRSYIAKID